VSAEIISAGVEYKRKVSKKKAGKKVLKKAYGKMFPAL